jgi:hypothetical protein
MWLPLGGKAVDAVEAAKLAATAREVKPPRVARTRAQSLGVMRYVASRSMLIDQQANTGSHGPQAKQ